MAKDNDAKTQRAGCMGCLTFVVLIVIVVVIVSAVSGSKSAPSCEGPAWKSQQACLRAGREIKHAVKPSAMYAATYVDCLNAKFASYECTASVASACEAVHVREIYCAHGQHQAEASAEAVKHAEHGELIGATPQERALEAVEK